MVDRRPVAREERRQPRPGREHDQPVARLQAAVAPRRPAEPRGCARAARARTRDSPPPQGRPVLPGEAAPGSTWTSATTRTCRADRDGPQHLVLKHRDRERGRGQVGDGAGDDVPSDRSRSPAGRGRRRTGGARSAGRRPAAPWPAARSPGSRCRCWSRKRARSRCPARPAQHPLARGVADHHRQPRLRANGTPRAEAAWSMTDYVEAEVVQAADHPGADSPAPTTMT